MQKQMTIEQVETDLSIMADRYLDAREDVKRSKEGLDDAEQKLINAMYEHKKYSLKHGGYVLVIKQGEQPKDKIHVREQ